MGRGTRGRLHPAQIAYGGADGRDERRMGGQHRRGDPLRHGSDVCRWGVRARLGEFQRRSLDRHQVPANLWATADDMPGQLAEAGLARLRRDHVDVYQHHSVRWVDIPRDLMEFMADAVAAGRLARSG